MTVLDASLTELERTGQWRALTGVPRKFELFALESYFRESWQAAAEVFGDSLVPALQGVAVLTLKPDAILGRRTADCLRYMAGHGFTPLLAVPVRYTPANTREIWRYQWNIASLDRLALSDVIHTSAQPVVMFFRDDRPDPVLPASVRLAGLKGSSLPWERGEHHLRTILGGLNRMIVMIHCSDEPIDVVRELGILLERRTLVQVYQRLRGVLAEQRPSDVDRALARVYQRHPEHHVCVDTAVDEVLKRLAQASHPAAAQAEAALHSARNGSVLSWRQWSQDLAVAGVDPAGWDVALAASHYIGHDLPGAVCVVSESGRERWLAGEGLRVPGPGW
jgi:hypothetical protein